MQNFENMIHDNCDVFAGKVINTFRCFVDICKPQTESQYESLANDAMEFWGCA